MSHGYLNLNWPSVGDKDCLPYCFYIQSGLHRINVNWPSIKYSKQFLCWMSHGYLNLNWPSVGDKDCLPYCFYIQSGLHRINANWPSIKYSKKFLCWMSNGQLITPQYWWGRAGPSSFCCTLLYIPVLWKESRSNMLLLYSTLHPSKP